MNKKPLLQEDHISQIPAIQLLVNMGYTYISPDEALQMRGGKMDSVLLTSVLETQLRKINTINFKDSEFEFSESNIKHAIDALRDQPLNDGLVRTNENIYELLTLGKSFEQRIAGDKKSFSFKYIDWENPENNVYHVSEEFEVERMGSNKTYRPDIVLFVNGIPLVVIEAKRPDLESKNGEKPIDQAMSQHIRNQKEDGILNLYKYSQILLSIATNDAKYATTATPVEFWAFWREQFETDKAEHEWNKHLSELKNQLLDNEVKDKLFAERFRYVRNFFDDLDNAHVETTTQDEALFSLLEPKRLLALITKYIVFDAGVKKIARYQQFFAVKKSTERVLVLQGGQREGGVVWHTQGSGKSLTMVMLAKSIALEKQITNPRVILVTDRIDLDDQIFKTFKNTGADVVQAKSGEKLVEIIRSPKTTIVTTTIYKFETAVESTKLVDEDPDIFVLVDESHRSQYGSAHNKMRKVFPNACYIGFTGTPLMKKDKNTARRFGGVIDKYTIDQAVKDGAVVPLLYEARHVVQDVNKKPLDAYFERISATLTPEQKADLKKKFAKADQLNQADQKIYAVAWDISEHYRDNWQGTGYKAQLTAPSKESAIKYKEYLDEIALVRSEVLISGPDTREGHEDIYDESKDTVLNFWEKMMKKHGNEKTYNKNTIKAFKKRDYLEIIIVVDKLLTGFDAPRNTVLYIARSLKEHTLLQAIARVNRVHEGKDFGYIIDYYGILGNLDQALTTYSSLSEFDEEDLAGTLANVADEIAKLKSYHEALWDIFKTLENKQDEEAYERLLGDEEIRNNFYEALSKFARTLKLALSTLEFEQNTPEETIKMYRSDVKFFLNLRKSVKTRYSEGIDYKQYEDQVQKLINTHVSADEVIVLTEEPVNIFEKDKFQEEVEKIEGKAAKADTIASRTAKTITEKMDEDPAFYKKFSKMLEEVIEEYRMKRITDAQYLEKVSQIMDTVVNKRHDDIPDMVKVSGDATAYYGILRENVTVLKDSVDNNIAGEIAKKIDEIISDMAIVDWYRKQDVINQIHQTIEDYIVDQINTRYDWNISYDEIDEIVKSCIKTAKARLVK